MQLNTRILATLALVCQVSLLAAEASRTSNPGSPYPPGCISNPLSELDLTGPNVALFFSDRIRLEVAHKIETKDPGKNLGEVQLDMYRVGCAEPNRSVIIAEFRLPPEWVDPRNSQLVLPWLGGNTAMDPFPFQFKSDVNTWGQSVSQFLLTRRTFGDYTGGWDDPRRFTWRYVLDVQPVVEFWDRDEIARYYNSNFSVQFYRSSGAVFLSVSVPWTGALLGHGTSLPLNGRLSGNWVEDGASDQGFLISISAEPPRPGGDPEPPADGRMVIFLSWFTFDSAGDMLWLTGAEAFLQGSSEVTVPIEAVEQGDFLGDTPARRSTVGTARLEAIECNHLELEYDLGAIGLGTGVMELQRPFALEVADYPCRDYAALQASIYPVEPR